MRANLTAPSAFDTRQDELYQDAVNALLLYDKAYLDVRRVVKSCSHKYTSAILFKERFHAFDDFRDALVALVRKTIDALEHIATWKKYSASLRSSRSARKPHIFVWNGHNFVLTVRNGPCFRLSSTKSLTRVCVFGACRGSS